MAENSKQTVKTLLKLGLYGGIVGGIVFGFMMQMMGQLQMVAGMMGSESLIVGWIIHLIISVIFGLGFGLLAATNKNLFVISIVYGIIIWIVGPLVIMPMMMGMGTNFANIFQPSQLMSLGTHIFYSIIVALVVFLGTKNVKEDVNVPV